MPKTSPPLAFVALALAPLATACSGASSVPSGAPVDGGLPGPDGAAPGCERAADVTTSETWSRATCPGGYLVTRDVKVRGAATTLTVEASTVLRFRDEGALTVEADAALRVLGSAEAPVTFTGAFAVPGAWQGVGIASNNPANRIEHAVFELAGSRDRAAALALFEGPEGQSGRVELVATRFARNKKHGLSLVGRAALPVFEDVTFEDNGEGAIRVAASRVGELGGKGIVLAGGGAAARVRVEAGIGAKVEGDVTWPSLAPGVYHVTGPDGVGGDLVHVTGHLTIAEGATFEMTGGSGFVVEGGGAGLRAAGTKERPIVFKGVAGSGWLGLTFGETPWTGNRLAWVEVHNAQGPAPRWSYYGTGDTRKKRSGVLLGRNFDVPLFLSVENLTVAGPNNADADLAHPAGGNVTLDLKGANRGRGPGGALLVETF